jgi:uncharacterized membrane protein YcaP (DUF421 family)
MNGGDNSLVGGLVSAVTLVTLNYGISYATFRSKRLEGLIEGRPQVIIHDGRVFEDPNLIWPGLRLQVRPAEPATEPA